MIRVQDVNHNPVWGAERHISTVDIYLDDKGLPVAVYVHYNDGTHSNCPVNKDNKYGRKTPLTNK